MDTRFFQNMLPILYIRPPSLLFWLPSESYRPTPQEIAKQSPEVQAIIKQIETAIDRQLLQKSVTDFFANPGSETIIKVKYNTPNTILIPAIGITAFITCGCIAAIVSWCCSAFASDESTDTPEEETDCQALDDNQR